MHGYDRKRDAESSNDIFNSTVPSFHPYTQHHVPTLYPIPMNPPIRVVLADDHDLVLEGLQSRLKDIHELTVVGTAKNGAEVLELLQRVTTDVVVLDLHMPGLDGFEVLRIIRDQKLPVHVLVLTALVDGLSLQQALELGAEGIALKTDPPRQTIEAYPTGRGGETGISAGGA